MSPTRSRMLAIGVLILISAPESARTQQVTVTGRVLERTYASWIGGATVRLSGSPPFFTDLDGLFRFNRVAPGRHTLTVQAMGYRTRALEIDIRADTTLTVEMDPDPVVLDSLTVRTGNITIRGVILDAVTGLRVLYAQVTVEPGFSTVGALSGQFRVPKVPAGRAVTVRVEAVEYLPARIALITDRDTTLTVELEHDSVGIRLIAQQEWKLEARSRSLPYPRKVLGQERLALLPTWTMKEVVDRELSLFRRWSRNDFGGRRVGRQGPWNCLFIDDVPQFHDAFLWGLWPGEVARVEIYDRGGMIRVYTKRYLVGLLGKEPGTMFYSRGGLMGPICH